MFSGFQNGHRRPRVDETAHSLRTAITCLFCPAIPSGNRLFGRFHDEWSLDSADQQMIQHALDAGNLFDSCCDVRDRTIGLQDAGEADASLRNPVNDER